MTFLFSLNFDLLIYKMEILIDYCISWDWVLNHCVWVLQHSVWKIISVQLFFSFCFSKPQKIEADDKQYWCGHLKNRKFGSYGYLKFSVSMNYNRPLTINSRTNFILDLHIKVGNEKNVAFPSQNYIRSWGWDCWKKGDVLESKKCLDY